MGESHTYYVTVNSEVKGPYAAGQLQKMWEAGTITAESQVCESGTEDWRPVDSFPEIFEQAADSAIQVINQPPMQAPNPIPQPSTTFDKGCGCVMLVILIPVAILILLSAIDGCSG